MTVAVAADLLWHVHRHTIPAALALLPGQMDTPEARAMLLAIGLQESEFNARRQGGRGTKPGNGPARGFWQFERSGGVAEILTATDTADLIAPICRMFLYEPNPLVCHAAIEHQDTLAACFARLLLWRDPRALPTMTEPDKGWRIYLARWRPGKPHPETWPSNFADAWALVRGV